MSVLFFLEFLRVGPAGIASGQHYHVRPVVHPSWMDDGTKIVWFSQNTQSELDKKIYLFKNNVMWVGNFNSLLHPLEYNQWWVINCHVFGSWLYMELTVLFHSKYCQFCTEPSTPQKYSKQTPTLGNHQQIFTPHQCESSISIWIHLIITFYLNCESSLHFVPTYKSIEDKDYNHSNGSGCI